MLCNIRTAHIQPRTLRRSYGPYLGNNTVSRPCSPHRLGIHLCWMTYIMNADYICPMRGSITSSLQRQVRRNVRSRTYGIKKNTRKSQATCPARRPTRFWPPQCDSFCFFSFVFFHTHLLSSFWTSRGHRCRPFSPPVVAFTFYRA